jgi:ribose transport system substrate-binding protein
MAKNGNVFALVGDKAYELGQAMAKSAAYGLLHKKAPSFVVAPAITITKSNLVQGYQQSLHTKPPAAVLRALGK